MQPLPPSMPQGWSLTCPGPSERLWHYAHLVIYFCRPCENKIRQLQGTVRMIFPLFPGVLCSVSLGLWSFWDQLRGNQVRLVSTGKVGYRYAWLWIKHCSPSGAGNVTSGIVGSEAQRRMETWRWRYVGGAVPTFVQAY